MTTSWGPDFCSGGFCEILVEPGFTFLSFVRKCSAHTNIQLVNALNDQQLFDAILQSSRRKEVARWATKLFKGIDEEVDYLIESNGTIRVQSGLNGNPKNELTIQIQLALAGVSAPVGTVAIVVD